MPTVLTLTELTSTEAVIEALGGLQAVSDLTSSKYKAVFNWKAGETFPAKTFVIMTDALHKAGHSAPSSLWGMTEAAEAAE